MTLGELLRCDNGKPFSKHLEVKIASSATQYWDILSIYVGEDGKLWIDIIKEGESES